MRLQTIEQKKTKAVVISLAALAIIGIIACFTGAFDIDMSIFSRTPIEDIFLFILGVLFYSGRFLFPCFLYDQYLQDGIGLDGSKQAQKE